MGDTPVIRVSCKWRITGTTYAHRSQTCICVHGCVGMSELSDNGRQFGTRVDT